MKYDFTILKQMQTAGFHFLTVNVAKQPINERLGVRQWGYIRKKPEDWETVQTWSKNKAHEFYGYCTGVNDIEVFDVDLKVIKDIDLRKKTWEEFISFLRDNIDSFDKKIAIYKTLNYGFHLVYRTTTNEGNLKLAKLKDSKEALFETRGVGGYAVCYTDSYNGLQYHEIQYLTDEERATLFLCARYYDYKEPDKEPENKLKGKIEPNGQRLSTWDDFNQRNSVWDVIRDDFKVVRDTSERTIIKRHGSESPHSGYIFKENQLLYLFSTGTSYPAEKALTAFGCYAWREHNGNYGFAAKELYELGYGERYIKEKPEPVFVKPDYSDIEFPILTLPDDIQQFILEANRTLNNSIDYMGATFLWCASLIIGNSYRIQIKTGWQEACALWIALVGKPGVGKSPSIELISAPLKKVNGERIKTYNKKMREYLEYQKLSKDEKKTSVEVEEPQKNQFIVDDLTTEALADLHEKVPNGVGVLKDEMNGWIKEMNRYRQGSDLEFWLSSWSNGAVNFVRKVARSAYVEKAFIPVMGGIQPGIINQVFTSENKDNGFVDRLLLSFPDLQVEKWNTAEMSQGLLDNYYYLIEQFNLYITGNSLRNDDGSIKPVVIKMSAKAKEQWEIVFNELTAKQNSDDENEYMKSMLPKQKSYIPRFALIYHLIDSYFEGINPAKEIKAESIVKAKLLSDYFISMSRKIKVENMESEAIDKIQVATLNKPEKEQIQAIFKKMPDVNRSKLAEKYNVSRQTVIRWISEIDK